jgi:hypothetical protein
MEEFWRIVKDVKHFHRHRCSATTNPTTHSLPPTIPPNYRLPAKPPALIPSQVGRRRAAFGVQDHKSLHTTMVGSKGMDFSSVANVFSGLFKDLGVVRRDHVHEVW